LVPAVIGCQGQQAREGIARPTAASHLQASSLRAGKHQQHGSQLSQPPAIVVMASAEQRPRQRSATGRECHGNIMGGPSSQEHWGPGSQKGVWGSIKPHTGQKTEPETASNLKQFPTPHTHHFAHVFQCPTMLPHNCCSGSLSLFQHGQRKR